VTFLTPNMLSARLNSPGRTKSCGAQAPKAVRSWTRRPCRRFKGAGGFLRKIYAGRRTAGGSGAPALLLLPRRLAQRVVDAVLPAGAVGLEMLEHVAVDAQRHHLLGIRHRRLRRRQIGGLGGRCLERLLGEAPRVRRPAAVTVVGHSAPSFGFNR